MARQRLLPEEEDLERRRSVAALLRGDSLDLDGVPPRPHLSLAAGVVVALLLCGAIAANASLAGRAPAGWDDDGSLVVDTATGDRYVADQGVLHRAPTLTAALLAGSRPVAAHVPHAAVGRAPLGEPLPGRDLPERPPSLPATPTGLTACWDGRALAVHAGVPGTLTATADGMLVRAAGDPVILLAGGRSYPISSAAITSLGYSAASVRPVPDALFNLFPLSAALDVLPTVTVDPSRGVPGVGSLGEVVADASTGRHLRVGDGALAPFINATSEALAPSPVREVAHDVIAAVTAAPPVGLPDVPATPPTLPAQGDAVTVCVGSSDGQADVVRAVDDPGTVASPAHRLGGDPASQAPDGTGGAGSVPVAWHLPRGGGALLGPLDLDEPASAEARRATTGIRVVAAGISHPVADEPALTALGYRREQTVLLPDAWLAFLVRGSALSSR